MASALAVVSAFILIVVAYAFAEARYKEYIQDRRKIDGEQ